MSSQLTNGAIMPLAAQTAPELALLLVGGLGGVSIAIPVTAVERVLPMAALTPVPEMPPHIVGVLNMHGVNLLVVNPRPLLGMATPPYHPDQRLLVISAITRYILWVDTTDRIVHAPLQDAPRGGHDASLALAPHLANVDGQTTLVLSVLALDPGSGGPSGDGGAPV